MPLILKRRFLPYFISQFMGAYNDNMFRSALVIMVGAGMLDLRGNDKSVLTQMAVGLFIFPFFVFSGVSGQIADRMSKSRMMIFVKIWEVGLMLLGFLALESGNIYFLIAILSGLGLQSTFFGPAKYGAVPALVGAKDLLAANAWVEAGTFMAILLGATVGSALVLMNGGALLVGYVMVAQSFIGLIAAILVPKLPAALPDLQINWNIFSSTAMVLKSSMRTAALRLPILIASWVWLMGSIFLAQLPILARDFLDGSEVVMTAHLLVFSVGVGVGAFVTSALLKGEISNRLTRSALFLLISFGAVIAVLYQFVDRTSDGTFLTLAQFMADPIRLFILIAFFIVSLAGGVMMLPMQTMLQVFSPPRDVARTFAAYNVVNSGYMTGGSIIATALTIALGFEPLDLLITVAVTGLLVLPSISALDRILADNPKRYLDH